VNTSAGAGEDKTAHECGRLLAGKNPTNLKVHLSKFHSKEFAEFEHLMSEKQKPAGAAANTDSTSTATSKVPLSQSQPQRCIDHFAGKAASTADVNRLQERMVTMFVGTGLTTTLVDHPDFRALQPGFKLAGKFRSFGFRTVLLDVRGLRASY